MPARLSRFFALFLVSAAAASAGPVLIAGVGCGPETEKGTAYVPSLDGAAGGADGAPVNGVGAGPITPSRNVVHVPRGQTRRFDVSVDLKGAPGLAQLTATIVSPDITVTSAPNGENRFTL